MAVWAVVACCGLLADEAGAATIYGVGTGELWLRADSLSLADGAQVETWPNSGGTAPDAARDLGNPQFKTNIIGGSPAVAFNVSGVNAGGDNERMIVPNFKSAYADNMPFTLFLVTKSESSVFGPTPNDVDGSIPRLYPRRGAFTYQQAGGGDLADVTIATVAGAAEITVFQHTGSRIEAWLNGESQGTAAIGLATQLGGDDALHLSWEPAATELPGYLAELVWYTGVLPENEIHQVGGSLGEKYGIVYVPEPSAWILASLAVVCLASRSVGRRKRGGQASQVAVGEGTSATAPGR
jgi:hypothetical protein